MAVVTGASRSGGPAKASYRGLGSLRVMVGSKEGGIRAPISRQEHSLGTFGSVLTAGNILQNKIPERFGESGRKVVPQSIFQLPQDRSLRSVKMFGFNRTRIPERGADGGVVPEARPLLRSITPELNTALVSTRAQNPEPKGSARFAVNTTPDSNSMLNTRHASQSESAIMLFFGVMRRIVKDKQDKEEEEKKKAQSAQRREYKPRVQAARVEQPSDVEAVYIEPMPVDEPNSEAIKATPGILQTISAAQRLAEQQILYLQTYLKLQPMVAPEGKVIPAVETEPQVQAPQAVAIERKTEIKVVQLVSERVRKMARQTKAINFKRMGERKEQEVKTNLIYVEHADQTNEERSRALNLAVDHVKALFGRAIGKKVVETANLLAKASPLLRQIGKEDKIDGTALRINQSLEDQEDLTKEAAEKAVKDEPALQRTKERPINPATQKQIKHVVTIPGELGDGGAEILVIMKDGPDEIIARRSQVALNEYQTETAGESTDPVISSPSDPESQGEIVAAPVIFQPLPLSAILRNPLVMLTNNSVGIRKGVSSN